MFDVKSLIGREIHQFRVDGFIAKGAMGMIYRAHDMILSRTVALKLIPKSFDADMSETEVFSREEALKRLIQEAKAAGKLAHPNIVTIYSYGETDDFKYICMEYVSGETLDRLIQEKTLSESEAFPIFEQILSALDAANKEHIVHRDIKPANVMIADDNRVKVMDFGIAKLPSLSLTVTGMVLGTPYYMSPEQISAKKVDIRSDIFSVGAVFYQALTGARPFEGANTATISYQIMLVDPTPPDMVNTNISPATVRVILKALAKDPAKRYQTPGEMLADLRAAMQKTAPGESDIGTAVDQWALTFQESTLRGRSESEISTLKAVPPLSSQPALPEKRSEVAGGPGPEKPVRGKDREGEEKRESRVRPDLAESRRPSPPGLRPEKQTPGDLEKRGLKPSVLIGLLALLAAGGVAFLALNSVWRADVTGPAATRTSSVPPATAPVAAPRPSSSSVAEAPIPAPAPAGSLIVDTTPAGAIVYLNGERKGEAPVTAPGLAEGKVSVLVEWADHLAHQSKEIEIRAGETALASFVLEAPAVNVPGLTSESEKVMTPGGGEMAGSPGVVASQEPGAMLHINIDPWDANVMIVMRAKSELEPVEIPFEKGEMRVSAGSYAITAWREGYEKLTERLLVLDDRNYDLNLVLRKVGPPMVADDPLKVAPQEERPVEKPDIAVPQIASATPGEEADSQKVESPKEPAPIQDRPEQTQTGKQLQASTGEINVRPTPTELSASMQTEKKLQPAADSVNLPAVPPWADRRLSRARLTVSVLPTDAEIRIVNLKAPYEPGMQLDPGRYQIEASKRGYQTQRKWILLSEAKPAEVSFELRETSSLLDIKKTVDAYKRESTGDHLKGIRETADAYRKQAGTIGEAPSGSLANSMRSPAAGQSPPQVSASASRTPATTPDTARGSLPKQAKGSWVENAPDDPTDAEIGRFIRKWQGIAEDNGDSRNPIRRDVKITVVDDGGSYSAIYEIGPRDKSPPGRWKLKVRFKKRDGVVYLRVSTRADGLLEFRIEGGKLLGTNVGAHPRVRFELSHLIRYRNLRSLSAAVGSESLSVARFYYMSPAWHSVHDASHLRFS